MAEHSTGVRALIPTFTATDLSASVRRQVSIELGVAHFPTETKVLGIHLVGGSTTRALEALRRVRRIFPGGTFAPLLDAGEVEHPVTGVAAPDCICSTDVIDTDTTLVRFSRELC